MSRSGSTALVLFAAPLWYAWQVTIQEGRAEILQADAQRLTDIFRRDGAAGSQDLHRHPRRHADRRRANPVADRCIACIRSPATCRLAGTRCRPTPGNYTIRVERGRPGDASRRWCMWPCSAATTCWWAGTTRCLRRCKRDFWYGLAAAIAVLSIAGLLVGLITRRALMSRVHSIRQTVSAIMHGDLKHRLPTQLERRRAQHPVAHHQRHARSDRAAGAWRAQCLQLHRARSAHAAGGIAFAARRIVAHPAFHLRRRSRRSTARWRMSIA